MSTVLRPIVHKDSYTYAVEKEIMAWMREAIFTPLLIELRSAGVPVDPQYQAIEFDEEGARENATATSAVEAALNAGTLHYADGKFTGKFGSAITKELRAFGATYNPLQKTFSIPLSDLPINMRGALQASLEKSQHLHEQVISTLTQMEANIAIAPLGINFARAVDSITNDLGAQFIASVSNLEGGIAVPAEFTPAMRKQLTETLTDNTDLYIRGWAKERIPQLRRRVEENVFAGMRTDKLARIIEAEFGVSKRKANFLADQETGLLTSKYRQARYQDVGVQEYIWQTSNDVRVRPDHRLLNNKRFNFSNPPITDLATGRRNNPGEDYRCRCVPRAILT